MGFIVPCLRDLIAVVWEGAKCFTIHSAQCACNPVTCGACWCINYNREEVRLLCHQYKGCMDLSTLASYWQSVEKLWHVLVAPEHIGDEQEDYTWLGVLEIRAAEQKKEASWRNVSTWIPRKREQDAIPNEGKQLELREAVDTIGELLVGKEGNDRKFRRALTFVTKDSVGGSEPKEYPNIHSVEQFKAELKSRRDELVRYLCKQRGCNKACHRYDPYDQQCNDPEEEESGFCCSMCRTHTGSCHSADCGLHLNYDRTATRLDQLDAAAEGANILFNALYYDKYFGKQLLMLIALASLVVFFIWAVLNILCKCVDFVFTETTNWDAVLEIQLGLRRFPFTELVFFLLTCLGWPVMVFEIVAAGSGDVKEIGIFGANDMANGTYLVHVRKHKDRPQWQKSQSRKDMWLCWDGDKWLVAEKKDAQPARIFLQSRGGEALPTEVTSWRGVDGQELNHVQAMAMDDFIGHWRGKSRECTIVGSTLTWSDGTKAQIRWKESRKKFAVLIRGNQEQIAHITDHAIDWEGDGPMGGERWLAVKGASSAYFKSVVCKWRDIVDYVGGKRASYFLHVLTSIVYTIARADDWWERLQKNEFATYVIVILLVITLMVPAKGLLLDRKDAYVLLAVIAVPVSMVDIGSWLGRKQPFSVVIRSWLGRDLIPRRAREWIFLVLSGLMLGFVVLRIGYCLFTEGRKHLRCVGKLILLGCFAASIYTAGNGRLHKDPSAFDGQVVALYNFGFARYVRMDADFNLDVGHEKGRGARKKMEISGLRKGEQFLIKVLEHGRIALYSKDRKAFIRMDDRIIEGEKMELDAIKHSKNQANMTFLLVNGGEDIVQFYSEVNRRFMAMSGYDIVVSGECAVKDTYCAYKLDAKLTRLAALKDVNSQLRSINFRIEVVLTPHDRTIVDNIRGMSVWAKR